MTKVISFPKVLSLLVISSLIYITAYAAYAKESTGTATTRKEKLEQKIETRKEKVAEKIENIKERMATREAVLKDKLKNFKDHKKASAAARINDNLGRINAKETSQMLNHLDKMSSILDKLEARVNQGKPDIKNIAEAKAAIATSRAFIASATAAVKAQAGKDYTIEITTESKVRQDAQKQREQLHADLKTVRKTVIDAKQSVSNAIRAAKSGSAPVGAGLKKEGTNSGQQ